MMRHALVLVVSVLAGSCSSIPESAGPWRPPVGEPVIERVRVPGTTVELEFVRLRGAADSGRDLCVARTEMTWALVELYHRRTLSDERQAELKLDGVTRPSSPYGSAFHDEWGPRETRPAMYVSSRQAREFASWISLLCRRPIRLMSESEWQRVCQADTRVEVDRFGWTAVNSAEKVHTVASLLPDPLGLFDLQGNVSEWVLRSPECAVLKGANFTDPAELATCDRSIEDTDALSEGDSQFPRSQWWRVGAPWAGFRVVFED